MARLYVHLEEKMYTNHINGKTFCTSEPKWFRICRSPNEHSNFVVRNHIDSSLEYVWAVMMRSDYGWISYDTILGIYRDKKTAEKTMSKIRNIVNSLKESDNETLSIGMVKEPAGGELLMNSALVKNGEHRISIVPIPNAKTYSKKKKK